MFTRAFSLSGKRRLVAVGLSALTVGALVAALAVTFMSLNARTAFGSGSGGGGCFSTTTTGPSCTFKGAQDFADFSSVSPDGCVFTDASVQPFQNLTNPGHTSTKSVLVFINSFDDCTGVPLIAASNIDPNTGIAVFNGTFTFDTKLGSASVNGTAPMFDFVSNTTFTSTVNVTWQGFGPTSSFSDSSQFRSTGFFTKSHFKGVSREAEASGTVTDESGDNLAATPSLNASLNNDSGGTVQIIKV